jgi:hypothetical protein
MKVRYREGIASRPDPESCGGAREGAAEELTGEAAGQPIRTLPARQRVCLTYLCSFVEDVFDMKAARQTAYL